MKNVFLVLLLILPISLVFGQSQISGTVLDENDSSALPGVTVQISGTQQGTQTDVDGKYEITASQGQTLVFSFIGMEKKEVLIGNQSIIDVVLSQQANQLNEVVVLTALGLERKKDYDLSSSTLVDASAIKRSGESGIIQGLS